MPLDVPSTAEIRDRMLALLRAEYQATGRELDVLEGSDASMRTAVLALVLEAIHQLVRTNTTQYFPDTAIGENLEHFARLYGIGRKPPTTARLLVRARGTSGSAWSIGEVVRAADGTSFRMLAAGILSGTQGEVLVEAEIAGAAGTRAPGSILTWQSAPVGIFPQLTVLSIDRVGTDAEDDTSIAQRVLAYLRERPGGGNRADWKAWAESIGGIERAFVYPLLHEGLGLATPGATTIVLLGPSGRPVLGRGDVDAATLTLRAKCPAGMPDHDLFVMTARPVPLDVMMKIQLGPGFRWSFEGTHTIAANSTSARINLSTNPLLQGPAQLVAGALVALGSPSERGQIAYRRVTRVGADFVELDAPLTEPPQVGARMLPAPTNALALRDAVLGLFDRLGPGDSYPPSLRFPPIAETSPPTLFRASLVAAVMGTPGIPGAPTGVPGVINAIVNAPVADTTPPALSLLVPGAIRFVA